MRVSQRGVNGRVKMLISIKVIRAMFLTLRGDIRQVSVVMVCWGESVSKIM